MTDHLPDEHRFDDFIRRSVPPNVIAPDQIDRVIARTMADLDARTRPRPRPRRLWRRPFLPAWGPAFRLAMPMAALCAGLLLGLRLGPVVDASGQPPVRSLLAAGSLLQDGS